METLTAKICRSCGLERDVEEFYRRGGGDGYQYSCKDCQRSPEAQARKRARMRRHRRENPEVYRARARRERLAGYGLTEGRFEEMLIAQAGRCGACGDTLLAPQVDHDHATGAVRGLLCTGCNTALGSLRDDGARILRLLAYLEA